MKRLFVFVALLGLAVATVQAQEMTSGTLEGTVMSKDGAPIGDAVVTAMGPQGVRTTVTDSQGRYSMRGLGSGIYKVKAEASGFSTIVQSDVAIRINRRTQLPFNLTTGVTEQITVTSEAPIVDMKSTGTGASIRVDDFAPYVPLGRNLVSLVTIAPGVSDGGEIGEQNQSISGSSGLENAYFVDGVNVTNAGFGALGSYSIVYGSLGSGVTYDFLEEVQVKTGGFEAEYGQAGGGVVNTVVRSGSNSFGFDVSWYEEPATFEGTRGDREDIPNFSNRIDTMRRDISLSTGGPIMEDRLFYFAAFNPVTIEEDFKLTSGGTVNPVTGDTIEYCLEDANGDGTCDSSLVSFETGQTIQGGRVPGSVTRERSIDNYAAKVSWFASPNHKIELTAFGDPSDGEVGPQNPTTFLRNLADPLGIPEIEQGATGLDYGGDQISLKYQGVWTSNFFTEILLSTKENNFTETGPGTTFRSFFNTITNSVTGGAGFYEDKLDKVDQIQFKNTHVFGPVEVSYGYSTEDIEWADPSFRSGPTFTSQFANLVDDVPVGVGVDGIPNTADDVLGIGLEGDGSLAGSYTPLQSTTGAAVDIISCTAPGGLCYNVTRTAFEDLDAVTTAEENNAFMQLSWDVAPNVTIKAGARWTEQELAGSGTFTRPFSTLSNDQPTGVGSTSFVAKTYKFDSEIAPRLGVSWDVRNNGKHKLFAHWGEYYQRVPSDLAVRQFSNEVGIEGEEFLDAGLTSVFNNATCSADLDGDGFYGDSVPCHIAEGVTGASPGVILDGTIDPAGDPDVGANPATTLPYTEEWLFGYAWEVNDYTSFEVRYINRELGRVLEDVQFASSEQAQNLFRGTSGDFEADVDGPGGSTVTIVPFDFNGDGTPAPGGGDPFGGVGAGSFGAYVLANPGTNINSSLFPVPVRDYRAWEFVYNRRFNDSWMAYANYRFAKLDGNYEGSYRNDNTQSDPFITSLFDFPAASAVGSGPSASFVPSAVMSGQFVSGPLNTDRRHVFNAFLSKQYGFGLNLGGRMTVRTGQPRFPLFAHPSYRNAGEIPGFDPQYYSNVAVDTDGDGFADGVGFAIYDGVTLPLTGTDYDQDGTDDVVTETLSTPRLFSYTPVARDFFGRNPTEVTFDMHASYDINLRSSKSQLTLLLDVFNLFNDNDALRFDNDVETRPGVANPDFSKARIFQTPRNVRLGAKFTW